jgi:hypothetical protein
MLREVSDRIALAEGVTIPDTVPLDLTNEFAADVESRNGKPLASV